ncbi:hypothetical protein EDC01DRAFT_680804 [Geopyxis carbonaria]|nr:hypothetical protein EDC01DRAFT_680804 [Geopyxis carbonaria]
MDSNWPTSEQDSFRNSLLEKKQRELIWADLDPELLYLEYKMDGLETKLEDYEEISDESQGVTPEEYLELHMLNLEYQQMRLHKEREVEAVVKQMGLDSSKEADMISAQRNLLEKRKTPSTYQSRAVDNWQDLDMLLFDLSRSTIFDAQNDVTDAQNELKNFQSRMDRLQEDDVFEEKYYKNEYIKKCKRLAEVERGYNAEEEKKREELKAEMRQERQMDGETTPKWMIRVKKDMEAKKQRSRLRGNM